MFFTEEQPEKREGLLVTEETDELCEVQKIDNRSDQEIPLSKEDNTQKNNLKFESNQNKEVQVDMDGNSRKERKTQPMRDKHISVLVKTTQQLQHIVKGYEIKVNETTSHINCLLQHIDLMQLQLSHKNQMIGRICDRYVALCKEKQISEDHLQHKLDELSTAVEACNSNNKDHLKKLLIQQINRNRCLEYENESLKQYIKLTFQERKIL